MASDLIIFSPNLPQPSISIVLSEIGAVRYEFSLKTICQLDSGLHLPVRERSTHHIECPCLLHLPYELLDAIVECLLIPGSLASHFRGLVLTNKALSASILGSLRRKQFQMNKWVHDLCDSRPKNLLQTPIDDPSGPTLHEATRKVLATLPTGFSSLDHRWYRDNIAYSLVMMFTCLTLAYHLKPDMDVAVLKTQQYWAACRWRKACWYMDNCNMLEVKGAYELLTERLQRAGIWVEELAWEDLPR